MADAIEAFYCDEFFEIDCNAPGNIQFTVFGVLDYLEMSNTGFKCS